MLAKILTACKAVKRRSEKTHSTTQERLGRLGGAQRAVEAPRQVPAVFLGGQERESPERMDWYALATART